MKGSGCFGCNPRDNHSVGRRLHTGSYRTYLKQLAADAVLRWAGGTSEDDWIRKYHIHAMEREYLEDAGVWPWGRDQELDLALREAHMETAEMTARIL